MEKVPESFGVQEMMARVEERTPYIVVAFQECERMNFLTAEIRRSLKELALGLKVCTYVYCLGLYIVLDLVTFGPLMHSVL